MKVPPEVEELIFRLEADYPRAAANIRLMWGPDNVSQEFFRSILTYQSGTNRQGFNPDAFSALSKIRDIYIDSYVEFKCINATKEERDRFRSSMMDVWDRALF